MTARTPQETATWLCPFARTFAAPKAEPHCQGPSCALWRWQELSADILTPHVKQRRADSGDDLKAATAWVMDNREALGIPIKPTHGYCGGGGRP